MLEWFYACAVTKYQNFSWILHVWYSLFQFLKVFANSCELNPTLAILPILCILMRLPDGDSPCCARVDKMTALCSVPGRKYPSTMIDVSINNTILKMEVDSGAEPNVITYSEFLKLSGTTLEPTQAKLKPYNSEPIQCKGMFKATIKSNKTQVQATFYVSEGTVKHNSMGKFTAFNLGILQIKTKQLHSSETEQFQEEWHNYKQQKNSKKKTIKRFSIWSIEKLRHI